jgi:hypothetical protein
MPPAVHESRDRRACKDKARCRRFPMLGRFGLLLAAGLLSACASTVAGPPPEGPYSDLHALYAAPHNIPGEPSYGGGMSRGGLHIPTESRSYKVIPAIFRLVQGEEDKDKFEVLLILLRDADFSVHRSAVWGIRRSYDIRIGHSWGAYNNEEQIEVYEEALRWWTTNRDQLRWSPVREKFIVDNRRPPD